MDDGWVGYINKSDYDDFLLFYYQERLNNNINFLKKNLIFSDMDIFEIE